MFFTARVFSEDYNGEEASTGITLEGVNSLTEVDAFIALYESAIAGISNGYITKAEARTKFAPTTPRVIKGLASAYDRLLIVCTNGTNYAGITIPAPGGLTYETQGPFAGLRVDKANPTNVQRIEALVTLLGNTLTPTGLPFPNAEWVAARMVNP